MTMTLVEKIFARKLGRSRVSSGETLFVPLDLVVGTDATAALSVKIFKEMGGKKVYDPDRIVFTNDHLVPAMDIDSANLSKTMREFATEQGIANYFDVGRSGICHVTIPEHGFVVPGDIVVGAESHTCTYGALGAFATGIGSTDMAAAWATGKLWFRIPASIKVSFRGHLNHNICGKDLILFVLGQLGPAGALYKAIEFTGPVIKDLSMADRFSITNMAVESGAKTGIIAADASVDRYLCNRTVKRGELLRADREAVYVREIEVNVSDIEPMVAIPDNPTNVRTAAEIAEEDVPVHQVIIGTCSNGWIEDFRTAYKILKGKKVHPNTRLLIIPGSPQVLKQMAEEVLLPAFIEAGAVIGPSVCGPCLGRQLGVLAEGEVGLYTATRNFAGRHGPRSASVYLSGPAVAAASAIAGKITVPQISSEASSRSFSFKGSRG